MTVHSRLWFAYYMNDQFDRADGLGAARHRHCLTSAMRSTSQPSVIRIRSANPVSARFAVVLDAFSRRVVGWSISHNPTAALTSNALGMAIDQREAARGETVIHSDHGTQFTSWAFTERARQSGLVPSMGSIGDCYDNAMIEAFWSRMQVELLNTRRWKTRVELANAIFEYIEIFHNRRRRHSSLGMRTPIEYELLNTPAAA